MGQWKIGYLNGLDNMGTYEAGMAAHHAFGSKTLSLSPMKMCRAIGMVSTIQTYSFTCTRIKNYPNLTGTTVTSSFENNEFNNGFVKMLTGGEKDNVYKVTDTTSSKLTLNEHIGNITDSDIFEVVTGACTFEFPVHRNPTRRDFKRMIMNDSIRYPYYGGGLVIPIGWQPDDFIIKSHLTNVIDADRLEVMLNHILDYKGFDGLYSIGKLNDNPNGFAPMIIETGSHYAQYQHLGNVVDYDITKSSKKSDDFYDVLIHFEGYNTPIYRGL